ncbi:hypothetical protein ATKI12_3858 [Kitasatospora sp. Ki12]
MDARTEDARPPGAFRTVARVLARGLLVLAGLATVAAGFGWFVATYHEMAAHRTAPVCGAAGTAPGTACVRHETGKVRALTYKETSDSTTYKMTVGREEAPAHTLEVGEAFYDEAQVGTDVDLKVWNGRVIEVSWHGHRATVRSTPVLTSFELALLIGAGTALTAYGLAWPRDTALAVPVLGASWTAGAAMLGSFLFTTTLWPLPISLSVPLLGWLIATAVTTAAAREG